MAMLTYDDARQLYAGCLVETKGKLGFVMEVHTPEEEGLPPNLTIAFIGERAHSLVDADPDTVLCPTHPYRLGYVQVGAKAIYLTRGPRRQYQVGWSENNVRGWNLTAFKRLGTKFRDNLMGVYPKYSEALQLSINDEDGEYAFDRMFAICRGGGVLSYKGTQIARIRDGEVNLRDYNVDHLEELFNKAKGE